MRVDGRTVVMAGRGVAAAFGIRRVPYLTWVQHRGMTTAILPHPSGVNRWYNDPRNKRAAERFLRSIIVISLAWCLAACSQNYHMNAGLVEFPPPRIAECYRTTNGVIVQREPDGECSRQRDVEMVVRAALRRMGRPQDSVAGLRVIFTPRAIDCQGIRTRGCSARDGTIMVTLEGAAVGRKGWGETLAHELTHADAFRAVEWLQ